VSMIGCDRCGDLIDSDDDPECFTEGLNGVMGDGPVHCGNCRERLACHVCGDHPGYVDDVCIDCTVHLYLHHPQEYQPNYTLKDGSNLYDHPGYREAKAKYLAIKGEA
jgi:hypothetical protein